mgnify:CR=1 FL=1|tara:strand:+ start:8007 stop:8225 length:219 start_codon:yes stop_codon:yes gene_type:complete
MTPKEKAIDLVDRYYSLFSLELDNTIDITQAKKCALIAVDEMLENDGWSSSQYEWDVFKKYFIKVKQEIEKL